MTAKPTLGYASRGEAVLALRAEGASTRQIAASIGIAVKRIVETVADDDMVDAVLDDAAP